METESTMQVAKTTAIPSGSLPVKSEIKPYFSSAFDARHRLSTLPQRNQVTINQSLDPEQHILDSIKNSAKAFTAEAHQQECDIFSINPDVGILSCKEDTFCTRSETSRLGGYCTDSPTILDRIAKARKKPIIGRMATLKYMIDNSKYEGIDCDPTSADGGILICAEDQVCESNSYSSLGGTCRKSTESRRLFTVDVCDPTSDYYGFYSCDCTTLNNTTGTGNLTCTVSDDYELGASYSGCDGLLTDVTFSYFFNNSELIAYDSCYIFSSPYDQKVCTRVTATGCDATFNDQLCAGCFRSTDPTNELFLFDCTNVEGGRAGNTETNLLEFLPIVQSCYEPPPVCVDLCGNGRYISYDNFGINVTVDGFDDVTCEYLAYGEENGDLSIEYCAAFTEAAEDRCCEDIPLCQICGDKGVKNPSASVMIGANVLSCAEGELLSQSRNEEECDLFVGLLSDVCCSEDSASPSLSPSIQEVSEPTLAPTTATESPTILPSSGGIRVSLLFFIHVAGVWWLLAQ